MKSNALDDLRSGRRWMRSLYNIKIWTQISVGIQRSAYIGNVIVRIVIRIERAINGLATFLEARLASCLDGDPSKNHRSDGYHRRRYCPHSDSDFDSALYTISSQGKTNKCSIIRSAPRNSKRQLLFGLMPSEAHNLLYPIIGL